MKKIIVVIVLIIIVLVVWFTRDKEVIPNNETIKTYTNANLKLSFVYPNFLTASTTNGKIVLHHDISYENHGDCDMMGDEKTYPRLTDFKVTIQKVNKGLVDTMKTNSPYIPQENFINNTVIASPGFIDPLKIGDFDGYAIYEGAEGCGQTTYYFPIDSNETLVINKASIQVLSGVISKEMENEVLAIPSVISREKYEEIFISIINSLKI